MENIVFVSVVEFVLGKMVCAFYRIKTLSGMADAVGCVLKALVAFRYHPCLTILSHSGCELIIWLVLRSDRRESLRNVGLRLMNEGKDGFAQCRIESAEDGLGRRQFRVFCASQEKVEIFDEEEEASSEDSVPLKSTDMAAYIELRACALMDQESELPYCLELVLLETEGATPQGSLRKGNPWAPHHLEFQAPYITPGQSGVHATVTGSLSFRSYGTTEAHRVEPALA